MPFDFSTSWALVMLVAVQLFVLGLYLARSLSSVAFLLASPNDQVSFAPERFVIRAHDGATSRSFVFTQQLQHQWNRR